VTNDRHDLNRAVRRRTRPERERELSVTDAQLEDAIQRLTARWVFACIKMWVSFVGALIVALSPVWGPDLWTWLTHGAH